MKNDDKIIVKYLSQLMSDDEKLIFENELVESPELNDAKIRIEQTISELKLPEEIIDERYFNNLLPRVHERLDKENATSLIGKLFYLIPTIAAGIIGLVFLFKPNYTPEINYRALAAEIVNNMSDKEVSGRYFDEMQTDPTPISMTDKTSDLSSLIPSGVELNDEVVSKYLNVSSVEEYSTLHDLSENDLEKISNNLNIINVNR
jgi:hypothetical protein